MTPTERYPAENYRVCLCTGLPIRCDNISGKRTTPAAVLTATFLRGDSSGGGICHLSSTGRATVLLEVRALPVAPEMSGVCRTKHHLVVVLYMPSAVAEAEAAAMDNAVDVWRLNTASRPHN